MKKNWERFIRVRIERLDGEGRRELARAIITGDKEKALEMLDGIVTFEGIVGAVLEKVDGVILDGIYELLKGFANELMDNQGFYTRLLSVSKR